MGIALDRLQNLGWSHLSVKTVWKGNFACAWLSLVIFGYPFASDHFESAKDRNGKQVKRLKQLQLKK